MFETLKKRWRDLKHSRPGCRFQERYRRHQETPIGRSRFGKILFVAGGLLLMAAGVFFVFVPGPGLVFLFLGGGMLASESYPAARFLDWSELKLRALVRWARGLWNRASPIVRVLVVVLVLVAAAAAGYGVYELFFGNTNS